MKLKDLIKEEFESGDIVTYQNQPWVFVGLGKYLELTNGSVKRNLKPSDIKDIRKATGDEKRGLEKLSNQIRKQGYWSGQ